MAMNPRDPAERAAEILRSQPVEGWSEISAAIMGQVRRTVMPSDPVVVHGRDGRLAQDQHGSRSYVSARVLVGALRTRLTGAAFSPSAIRITTGDDDRCTEVTVEIVCSWDTDFQLAGRQARDVVVSTLVDMIGDDPDFDADASVHVHVGDVTEGDTRTT
ncbi:hypothetical protein [Solicola sp. PLA-1-18]|uniref:hypothetical protein n=1 Tax=Solicola sp. PLA-1-18 TaxID=3380532 RepID=UPI003B7A0C95